MIGPVLSVLVQELLALVPQRVHATLEIDHEPALVGDDQALLRRRDQVLGVQRLRGKYI